MERQFRYEPSQCIQEIVVGKCVEGKCRIESPQIETIGPNHKRLVFHIIVWLYSLGSSRAMEHYKKSCALNLHFKNVTLYRSLSTKV